MTRIFLFVLFSTGTIFAQAMPPDAAWESIKTYQYGDDLKPLLMIEDDVQRSTASPETKAKTAARLAALLDERTSYPGRQFVCLQLRLIGGSLEVPKLTEYLFKPEDVENARMALEDIRCGESLVPLRKALETFEGKPLVGVIGTLAVRGDKTSIPKFAELLASPDKTVAQAAASALGSFGMDGIEVLKKSSISGVGPALVEAAFVLEKQGKSDEAKKLFKFLAESKMPKGVRRAAFEGTLRLQTEAERKATVTRWLFEKDDEKNTVAVSHLNELSVAVFDELLEKTESMDTKVRIAFFEIATERKNPTLRPKLREGLLRSLKSSDAIERLTALRSLGTLKDTTTISVFVDELIAPKSTVREAATSALLRFPREIAGPALVQAMQNDSLRHAAIDVLVAMKYYEAIDPMLKLARSNNEKNWSPAVDGLAKLCDPDEHDLLRMLRLYLDSRSGVHRERVERAVVTVCEKMSDADARGDKLLEALGKRDGGLSDALLVRTLPLLGKLGNARVAELVRGKIDSNDPALQQSAVRAFCNWPNADYCAELWKIASENPSPQYRQWALRAFVRVVTLKSDRPAGETLAMLQQAMQAARADADKQWTLSRATSVRTLASAEWAASYLDDSALSQTACTVLVELAHHRFLREPNKAKFEPLLLKVERIAKDKNIAERAKKSRLGM